MKYVFVEAEGRLGMGVWGAEPPNGGMAAIPNSEVISITPELLFPHLGAGEKACVLVHKPADALAQGAGHTFSL